MSRSTVFPEQGNERRRMESAFPKACSCGAVYDESEWTSLPAHGFFAGIEEKSGRRFGSDLEIRVCVCGSSISVELERQMP